MPRLFIASGIFHPDPGGPATYLHQLLPALQERGWDIRVLSYGDAPSTYPYHLQRIPRRALPWRQLHYAAAAHMELRQTDLVFAQSLDLPLIGGRAPRVLRLGGDSLWERARRRGWLPASIDGAQFQNYKGGPLLRSLRAWRRRKLRSYAAVVVPSETLARIVSGWGVPSERLHVIENAVHALPAALSLSQKEARARLRLPPGPILLTVARLQPWKGIGPSIHALAQLPDLRLLVAGDGPTQPQLEAQAARSGLGDRIRFLGRLNAPILATYYRAADFVLLYSGYEGLSHVLLEALSYGTPVLASDILANRELIHNGVNGLLIPYETEETAASARIVTAVRAATVPDRRAQWASAGLLEPERYTFARLVERTDSLLRAQLARV